MRLILLVCLCLCLHVSAHTLMRHRRVKEDSCDNNAACPAGTVCCVQGTPSNLRAPGSLKKHVCLAAVATGEVKFSETVNKRNVAGKPYACEAVAKVERKKRVKPGLYDHIKSEMTDGAVGRSMSIKPMFAILEKSYTQADESTTGEFKTAWNEVFAASRYTQVDVLAPHDGQFSQTGAFYTTASTAIHSYISQALNHVFGVLTKYSIKPTKADGSDDDRWFSLWNGLNETYCERLANIRPHFERIMEIARAQDSAYDELRTEFENDDGTKGEFLSNKIAYTKKYNDLSLHRETGLKLLVNIFLGTWKNIFDAKAKTLSDADQKERTTEEATILENCVVLPDSSI